MTWRGKVWTGLLITAAAFSAAARFTPYFPGDVQIARLFQSFLPAATAWADWVSRTATPPWSYILLALTLVAAWALAGGRAALLALASYGGAWFGGLALGAVISQPRPSADLVRVAKALPGSAYPSLFALVYAATFGYLVLLVWRRGPSPWRPAAVAAGLALGFVGFLARLALGAHWPSGLVLSYLLGLLWAALLVRFV
jgi:undecaprenyl-diphosphatase